MNRRVTRRAALGAGLSAAAGLAGCANSNGGGAPVPKGDGNKWGVGKTVLPKRPDPRIVYPGPADPDGNPTEFPGGLRGAAWEVKAEKGTRVEVVESGLAGWVEKELLVPLPDAVEFYTKALEENAKDYWPHNFRGWAYHLLGKPAEAAKDLGEFLKLVPTPSSHQVIGLSNRGLILAEAGKLDDALKDLDEAGKFDHLPALLNRGWAYELKGDYKRAATDYANLLASYPSNPLVANNLAWLRATCPDKALRDSAEAVKLAKGVCERTADREGAHLDTLAAAHAEAGAFAEAVRAQEKALEDVGFAKKYGDEAQKRLQLYKDKKPYRSAPLR